MCYLCYNIKHKGNRNGKKNFHRLRSQRPKLQTLHRRHQEDQQEDQKTHSQTPTFWINIYGTPMGRYRRSRVLARQHSSNLNSNLTPFPVMIFLLLLFILIIIHKDNNFNHLPYSITPKSPFFQAAIAIHLMLFWSF